MGRGVKGGRGRLVTVAGCVWKCVGRRVLRGVGEGNYSRIAPGSWGEHIRQVT